MDNVHLHPAYDKKAPVDHRVEGIAHVLLELHRLLLEMGRPDAAEAVRSAAAEVERTARAEAAR